MENNRYYAKKDEIIKEGEALKAEYGIEFSIGDIISILTAKGVFKEDVDEYRDFCIWARINGGIK
jgi:hypothetical protein